MTKKRTTRTTKERQSAKRVPKRSESESTFRVWKLGTSLRQEIAEKRQSRDQTIRAFVADSLESELPRLITDLAKLGVSVDHSEHITPVRVQMEKRTLESLRHASQATGLDQSQLFIACLRLASRRKRRRTTA
jgi:hypothetical protein